MAVNILDERRFQMGTLEETSIVGRHGQTISVDRAGIVALVSPLGAGFMERHFSLQQDAATYEGCRIALVSGPRAGRIARIEFHQSTRPCSPGAGSVDGARMRGLFEETERPCWGGEPI
jgi:hypothetical protein